MSHKNQLPTSREPSRWTNASSRRASFANPPSDQFFPVFSSQKRKLGKQNRKSLGMLFDMLFGYFAPPPHGFLKAHEDSLLLIFNRLNGTVHSQRITSFQEAYIDVGET